MDFGEGKKGIYALEGATVLCQRGREVQLSVNEFGHGLALIHIYAHVTPLVDAEHVFLPEEHLLVAGSKKDITRLMYK